MLDYLVAGAPLVSAGVALLWLRWSAVRAGIVTLVVALAGALLWPGLESGGLGNALFEGIGTSWQVLYVLFGGLLLYNLLSAGGAIEEVSRFLGALEPEREALALVVVIGAAPFFESVTGFGVAVVISAPILLAAGFSPLRAAVLASWGQCAVPWGALGVGTLIGADLADMSFGKLSNVSALLNLPLFVVYGLAAVILAGGWSGFWRHGLEAIFLGFVAGTGTLLASVYLIPELASAIGGLAVTVVFLILRRGRLSRFQIPLRALSPYGFLLALLAVTNGPGVIQTTLESLGPIFTGPGLPLLVSGVFTLWALGLHRGSGQPALRKTLVQWLPTAGAVLTFGPVRSRGPHHPGGATTGRRLDPAPDPPGGRAGNDLKFAIELARSGS